MGTNKYYVVWKGFAPGVYDSWEEAEMQVSGYPDASYRAFKTMEAAVEAFREGFDKESLIKEVAREMERLEKEGTVIEFDKETCILKGEIVNVSVDEQYMSESGRLMLERADLIAYSHGEYFSLGEKIGRFGYSVRRTGGSAKPGTAKGKPAPKGVKKRPQGGKKIKKYKK